MREVTHAGRHSWDFYTPVLSSQFNIWTWFSVILGGIFSHLTFAVAEYCGLGETSLEPLWLCSLFQDLGTLLLLLLLYTMTTEVPFKLPVTMSSTNGPSIMISIVIFIIISSRAPSNSTPFHLMINLQTFSQSHTLVVISMTSYPNWSWSLILHLDVEKYWPQAHSWAYCTATNSLVLSYTIVLHCATCVVVLYYWYSWVDWFLYI